jgi:hypothetical protein
MIDQYSEYQAQIDALSLEKQALVDSILTPEIKAQLAAIDAEFAGKAETAQGKMAELSEAIKNCVIAQGETAKGAHHQFCFTKGRESWDGKSLSGYAAAHPEILAFRKVGDPSVSVRKVG